VVGVFFALAGHDVITYCKIQKFGALIPFNSHSQGKFFEIIASNYGFNHRWALASRKLTTASAFWHLPSESGTGTKTAGLGHFIPVPD
jgi:hypothetical protein